MKEQDEPDTPKRPPKGLELVARVRAADRRRRERHLAALQDAFEQGVAAGFEAGVKLVSRDEEPS